MKLIQKTHNPSVLSAYIELTKPRILTLILVTTAIGFFLGGHGIHSFQSFSKLLLTLLGAACTCAGASALNHYLERDVDGKMDRTRLRPIPMGVIKPTSAMLYGIVLILFGVIELCWKVNLLTAFLSLLTAFLYVLVYTPMKRVTWLNTTIGAIPGAIPPMGGWAAASGDLGLGAWVLFLILFVWQHPHFYAIAWMLKDDYKKAGFKMLPVVHPDGKSTFLQIIIFSIVLVPVSILPATIGMSGRIYFGGALFLSLLLLGVGSAFAISRSTHDAHRLLRATVFYLPLLLFLIIFDLNF